MVEKEFSFQGRKYVSLRNASRISGYAKDYIGQLCRADKIHCERNGRDWFVDKNDLLEYKQDRIKSFEEKNGNGKKILFQSESLQAQKSQRLNLGEFLRFNLCEEENKKLIAPPVSLKQIAAPAVRGAICGLFIIAIVLCYGNYTVGVEKIGEKYQRSLDSAGNFIASFSEKAAVGTVAGMRERGGIAEFENLKIIAADAIDTKFDRNNFQNISAKNILSDFGKAAVKISYAADKITHKKILLFADRGICNVHDGVFGKIFALKKINFPEREIFVYVKNFKKDFFKSWSDTEKNNKLVDAIYPDQGVAALGQSFSSRIKNSIANAGEEIKQGFVMLPENVRDLAKEFLGIKNGQNINQTQIVNNSGLQIQQNDISQLRKDLEIAKKNGLIGQLPIVQKTVVEKQIEKIFSGLTTEQLDEKLNQLNNKLMAQILDVKNELANRADGNFHAISYTQKIDHLTNTAIETPTISSPTVTGTLTGASASFSGNVSSSGNISAATLSVTGATALNGVEYTWPSADGTANYVLSTNGAGILSWVENGAGSIVSGTAGQFAYYAADGTTLSATSSLYISSSGNVGIASSTPFTKLGVIGNAYIQGDLTTTGTITLNGITYTFPSAQSASQYLKTDGSGGLTWETIASGGSGTVNYGAAGSLTYYSSAGTAATGTTGALLTWDDTNARLGIGTTSPYAKLSVVGEAVAEYFTATSTTATSTFPYFLATQSNVGTVVGGLWQGSAITDAYISSATAWNNKWDLASSTIAVPYGGTGSTTLTGLLKGNGIGAIQTAIAGTDYLVSTAGDWAGTFDSREGAYYLDATNLTNFGNPFYDFFNATNTDALSQGSTNKYWSDTLWDERMTSTTTLPRITTLSNLSITASQVSDFNNSWDERITSTTTLPGITTLANLATIGTITSGTWNAGALTSSGALTINGTGNSYIAGKLGIGTTSPYAKLSVVGEAVAEYFTATSTTATSTFAGGVSFGKDLAFTNTATSSVTMANGLNFDNGTFVIDPNSGNVGIGTTTPNNLLSVYDLIDFNNTDFNTKLGYQAGKFEATGAQYNTYLGYQAGYASSTASTNAADYNTFLGYQAGYANTTGNYNLAVGNSLIVNTTGTNNTAVGSYGALSANTDGDANTAVGYSALRYNTTGSNNTALGYLTLRSNTTGTDNIAIGNSNLYNNQTGSYNVVIGNQAGYGFNAFSYNNNVLLGYQTGYALRTGDNNVMLGYQAGDSVMTGANNIFLGYMAGENAFGSNNIVIGYDIDVPSANASNQLSIGNLIFGTGVDGTEKTVSSGSVAIGTSSPYAKLSVWGDGTSGLTAFNVVDSASTTLFSILDNGNVGIASSSPFTKLGVIGDAYIQGNLTTTGTITLNGITYTFPNSQSAGQFLQTDGSGALSWATIADSGTLNYGGIGSLTYYPSSGRTATGTTNSLLTWDDTNARLGIGTTSPYAKLSVWGSGTGSNQLIQFADSASSTLFSLLENGKIIASSSLSAASGNEVAYTLNYLTNKVAGNDTGLLIQMSDVASPGTSRPLEIRKGNSTVFEINQYGNVTFGGSLSNSTGQINLQGNTGINSQTMDDVSSGNVFSFVSGSGDELTDTDAEQSWLYLEPKINQSATANYAGLLMNITETGLGSGNNYLMDLRVAGDSKFNVRNNGLVGIGTTSPYAKLSVAGDVVANYFAATSTTATSTFAGGLSAASSLYVLQNGNVGIGTAAPNYLFEVAGSASVDDLYHYGDSNTYLDFGTDEMILRAGGIGFFRAYESTQDIAQINAGQVDMDTEIYWDNGMALLIEGSSGKIGIGTTTPNWNLQIASSTKTFLTLSDMSAGTNDKHWFLSSMGGNFYIGTSTDALNATSTYLTINNKGYIGIATTTPGTLLSIGNGDDYVNISNTATSTFAYGINLTNGCFSVNGTCISGGSGWDSIDDISLTKGYMIVGDDSGLAQATSTLFVSSTGKLGIGTTTPNWNLQIAGTRPSLALSDMSAGTDNKHWLFSSMGGNLYIGTSTDGYATTTVNTGLTILSNGNVGIGTASPGGKLEVYGDAPAIRLWDTGEGESSHASRLIQDNKLLSLQFMNDNGSVRKTMFSGGRDNNLSLENGAFVIQNGATVNSIYLNSSGNVGIGTTTPNWNLQIASSTKTFLTLSDMSAGTDDKHWFLSSMGGNFYIGTSTDALNATSTYLTINNKGYLGVGTTNPNNTIQVADLINFDNTNYGTYLGYQAGKNVDSTGLYNVMLGYQAGYTATSSDGLTMIGYKAGYSHINGATNASSTFIGSFAGYSNTTGYQNTFIGGGAGYSNTTGLYNTAVGYQALRSNSVNSYNSAFGHGALSNSTGDGQNTAMGYNALGGTTSGASNSGFGSSALQANTSGFGNSAFGKSALYRNTTGRENSGFGAGALFSNMTGRSNSALGYYAGYGVEGVSSYSSSTLVGYLAGYSLNNGSGNILLGHQAGYGINSGATNIIIGYNVDAPSITGSQQLNIGNVLYGTGLYNGESVSSAPVSGGMVGIGTTSPYAKLSVWGSGTSGLTKVFEAVNSASSTLFSILDNSIFNYGRAATNTIQSLVNSWNISTSTAENATPILSVDGLNGRIGIGSSTPNATLVLAGNLPSIMFGDGDTGFIEEDDDVIRIQRGSGFDWRINSTGIVGYSNVTPGMLLQGSSLTSPTLVPNRGNTNTGIGGDYAYNNLSFITGNLSRMYISGTSTQGKIGIASTSPMALLSVHGTSSPSVAMPYLFAVASSTADYATTTHFVITNTGKVGIGTANPNNTIQVADLINFDNTDFNTSLGYQAGKYVVSGAQQNTFLGYKAGYSSSTASTNAADYNTGVGYSSLYSNTTGNKNSSLGYSSLASNTTGASNNAFGFYALYFNTFGAVNNAFGNYSLYTNSTGIYNSAFGDHALYSNTVGSYNNALGLGSLYWNTSGASSTAVGYYAGFNNTTGYHNVFEGFQSGDTNTTGYGITTIGADADVLSNNLSNATAIGYNAIVGASNSLVLGGTGAYGVNVGIGTTSPYAKLSIHAGATDTYNPTLFSIASSTGAYATTTIFSILNNGIFNYGRNATNTITQNINAWSIATSSSATPILSINGNTGYVGVGTTSPSEALSIGNGGKIRLSATDGDDGEIYVDTQNFMQFQGVDRFYFGGGYANITSTSAFGQTFTYYATQNGANVGTAIGNGNQGIIYMMSYASRNNVGIGTSSPFAYLSVHAMATSSTDRGFPFLFTVASSTADYATTTHFVITNTGKVGIGSTTPVEKLSVDGLMYIGGTGTSTIENNLYVMGTLRSAVSYVGDLVFANDFRFVEEPEDAVPQALILKNQKGEDILTIDEDGNLNIAGIIKTAATSTGETVISEGFAWILDQFKSIGVEIWDGVVKAKEFIAEKVTAKKVVTDGLEMKDSVTGETYCVRITNGEWEKFKGTCGEISEEISPNTQYPMTNDQSNSSDPIINDQADTEEEAEAQNEEEQQEITEPPATEEIMEPALEQAEPVQEVIPEPEPETIEEPEAVPEPEDGIN